MKITYKILSMATLAIAMLGSCSDFDEVNTNPSAAGDDAVHPDYSLNKSFYEAQMDPDIAERVFVYNWASITRIVGENTMGVTARYNDQFNDRLYTYSSNWIKSATAAIELADKNKGKNEHEIAFYKNVKQIARIWRVMLIADFVDSFGPYPLNAFTGVAPQFNSEEEVYNNFFTELKEASSALDITVKPTDAEAKGDPAFKYDAAQWQKLANSLRLRYALQLSEVNNAKAKAEFEEAAKLPLLTEAGDLFGFQENGGWSAYEGVMNRGWSDHCISSTMCNLLTGLGNIPVKEIAEADKHTDLIEHIKPINYVGEKYEKHYPALTDNPTKQLWMDGIPEYLDPRALVVWCLTNDTTAANWPDQAQQGKKNHDKYGMLDPNDKEKVLVKVDAAFTWNGYPAGTRSAWTPKTFAFNQVLGHMWETTPMLSKEYRNNTKKRIWMSPWETYFLLAEGAVYGWATPMTAKEAYENGVKANFTYFGVDKYADRYLASTNYNRVGTSVSFDHTAEPVNFEADYKDGYTKEAKKMTYHYPDASKILYKGHKLNDQLTKIITQKYIANTPYGVVQSWNDRRRLGLPFFEVPGNETALTGSDFDGLFTADSYKDGQKWYHFTQRMRYPSVFENSDKEQFQNALKLLGTENNTMMTPLWWAIKK